MAIHKIPVSKLSAKALKGVIQEFVTRDGTGLMQRGLTRPPRMIREKTDLS
jgi:uncharacterized protein YheU (UPF0270 family)